MTHNEVLKDILTALKKQSTYPKLDYDFLVVTLKEMNARYYKSANLELAKSIIFDFQFGASMLLDVTNKIKDVNGNYVVSPSTITEDLKVLINLFSVDSSIKEEITNWNGDYPTVCLRRFLPTVYPN